MKAKYGNGWEQEFQSYVSPSRILEWDEERKRLERDLDGTRETLMQQQSAMIDAGMGLVDGPNGRIEFRNVRAEAAESQLSAALQRIAERDEALRDAQPWIDKAGTVSFPDLDKKLQLQARIRALLTEAPEQGGSK
jgi:hypothetical protein